MKILFLAHLLPLPLDSGGKIKSYYTLRTLSRAHTVHLLAYIRTRDELRHIPDLEQICFGVDVVELRRGKAPQAMDFLGSIGTAKSFVICRDFRHDMLQAVRRLIQRFQPDVIHIDHLQMAQFVNFDGAYLTVLDNHNVESAIVRRIAKSYGSLAARVCAMVEWPKLQRFELDVCRKCNMVLTVSEEDKDTLLRLDPTIANIHTVPIGVDVDQFHAVRRTSAAKNILSIGTMYWPPNVDSILHFCRDILPLIRKQIPDCTLTVAGQRPAPAIRALESDPRIKVTGYVDDIRKTARDCGVFIIPLRSGSGVRVKALNAMAMALPIVSTSIGMEGLQVKSGEHVLLADTPREFAEAVVRVLTSPQLAEDLGRSARKLVCENYSWQTIGKRLLSVYDQQLAQRVAI